MEKTRRGGVVTDLVSGTGALIVAVVIVLVIVSTLLGANLLNTTTHTNETFDENGYINPNETYYQLGVTHNASRYGFTIIEVLNDTGDRVITSGNYTWNTTGAVFNATDQSSESENFTVGVLFNYTFMFDELSREDQIAEGMSGNLTSGIANVSEKIPTILLIAAVILLFGVLIILVAQSRKMGIGAGGSSQL